MAKSKARKPTRTDTWTGKRILVCGVVVDPLADAVCLLRKGHHNPKHSDTAVHVSVALTDDGDVVLGYVEIKTYVDGTTKRTEPRWLVPNPI